MGALTRRADAARHVPTGILAAGAALCAYALVVLPWLRRWGATGAEVRERLPGDELPGRTTSTRAVTIRAPAWEVWSWLVQLGQDRGGFYSYTWIENGLFRAGIRNTSRIVPQWQKLDRGDFVPAVHRDWMGGRFADRAGWRVADIDPGHYFVLEGWGTFLVRPLDEARCRLVVRSHGPALPWWIAPLDPLVLEPGHFLMERKMMLRIKALAERSRPAPAQGLEPATPVPQAAAPPLPAGGRT